MYRLQLDHNCNHNRNHIIHNPNPHQDSQSFDHKSPLQFHHYHPNQSLDLQDSPGEVWVLVDLVPQLPAQLALNVGARILITIVW